MFGAIMGCVREVFGGAMEVCRMTGEVAASVWEVFRRVGDVGWGEGRIYGMVGLRDGKVGVVGCWQGSTLRGGKLGSRQVARGPTWAARGQGSL